MVTTEVSLCPPPYVELLGRSYFSFLQGASSPEEMVSRAQELGYQGLALCDLDGLYGVVRAHRQAYQVSSFDPLFSATGNPLGESFQFICGAELRLKNKSSLALLPMNKEGYTQLCRLITTAKRPAPKTFSQFDLKILKDHSDDLIVLALPPWSLEDLQFLHELLGDRMYLPIWRDMTWESHLLERQAFQLETQWGLQLVATQRPVMHLPERKALFDVLTCSLHGVSLSQAKTRLLSNQERYLKSPLDLAQIWRDRPDLLKQSVKIAQRISFSFDELKYQYPKAAVPKSHTSQTYLQHLAEEGLKWRFPQGPSDKVLSLLRKELALIEELQYQDYFLTLWDICEFARKNNILYQGRGSAANSVVCYLLGLTSVDPEKIDLLFERFISKERGEPPDIDVDFESDRREEVLQYVYRRYGVQHAAMVCTVICYRSKMALREVAKALEVPSETLSSIVRSMGKEGLKGLWQSFQQEPSLPQRLWGLSESRFRLLIELTSQLYGFPRHIGIHTGGFVITQRPITECVPVEQSTMADRFVVQWNKDDLEALKMMKIDLLGLGMLTALKHSFALLKSKKGLDLSLAKIPSGDPKTYQMIQRAETIGVFQIESRAQMSLLPRLRPKCFYDLVVQVAIVRPGPIQGGMVHPYLKRRHGLEREHYPHPALIPILSKTYGVPIFQEQIMQMASAVCGFTPGEADELRRLMSSSWKKPQVMQGLRQRLINGMLNHDIEPRFAEQIYQMIVGFSSYGFPESHAASFALITYASSYLKAHHPDVFVCSLLNSQPMGFYAPRTLIAEAQRQQVPFLPLDVQHSDYDYALEPSKGPLLSVRVGFRALFGLHRKWTDQLLLERRERGGFSSLEDFVRRTELPRSALILLAAAGALSSFEKSPRRAIWKIQSLNLDRKSFFFSQAPLKDVDRPPLPPEAPWQQMQREYSHQGYSLTLHPLRVLRSFIREEKISPWTSASLKKLRSGQRVTLVGLLSTFQKPPTAKGFAFLTLE